jgi:hypothetical protein
VIELRECRGVLVDVVVVVVFVPSRKETNFELEGCGCTGESNLKPDVGGLLNVTLVSPVLVLRAKSTPGNGLFDFSGSGLDIGCPGNGKTLGGCWNC